MDLRHLFVTSILSVESRPGQLKIWIHTAKGRYPLVNWPDLETPTGVNPAAWLVHAPFLQGERDRPSNN
jgi:hypothetical protein